MVCDHFVAKNDGVKLSLIQFLTAGILGCILMFIFETPNFDDILNCAIPILYAGCLSGGVGYTLQIVAQRDAEPTVASLLMSLESVFGVLFGAADAVSEAAAEGTAALPGLSAVFTQAAAFSYMAFNLLCMPCFAAVGAIKKEMGSWKWTGITIAFQMITAYIVAFIVYHVCMFIF